VEQRGCELLYLPSYSPDLNPIEEAFAKIKHLLREACARSRGALVEAIGAALSGRSVPETPGASSSMLDTVLRVNYCETRCESWARKAHVRIRPRRTREPASDQEAPPSREEASTTSMRPKWPEGCTTRHKLAGRVTFTPHKGRRFSFPPPFPCGPGLLSSNEFRPAVLIFLAVADDPHDYKRVNAFYEAARHVMGSSGTASNCRWGAKREVSGILHNGCRYLRAPPGTGMMAPSGARIL